MRNRRLFLKDRLMDWSIFPAWPWLWLTFSRLFFLGRGRHRFRYTLSKNRINYIFVTHFPHRTGKLPKQRMKNSSTGALLLISITHHHRSHQFHEILLSICFINVKGNVAFIRTDALYYLKRIDRIILHGNNPVLLCSFGEKRIPLKIAFWFLSFESEHSILPSCLAWECPNFDILFGSIYWVRLKASWEEKYRFSWSLISFRTKDGLSLTLFIASKISYGVMFIIIIKNKSLKTTQEPKEHIKDKRLGQLILNKFC